jgi:hypothetical protein
MTWEPVPESPAAPVAPVATAGRRSSRWLDILLAGAAVLAIAAVAFAVGRTTAPVAAASAFERGGFGPGGAIVRPDGSFDPGAGPRGMVLDGGLSISGTVTAFDADSVTVKLESGREMTFALDGSTTYHEATDASSTDVAVGDDVSVKVEPGAGPVGNDSSDSPGLSASDVTVTR